MRDKPAKPDIPANSTYATRPEPRKRARSRIALQKWADFISGREAAMILPLSSRTLRRLSEKGYFPKFLHPGLTGYYYKWVDLRDFMDKLALAPEHEGGDEDDDEDEDE